MALHACSPRLAARVLHSPTSATWQSATPKFFEAAPPSSATQLVHTNELLADTRLLPRPWRSSWNSSRFSAASTFARAGDS